MNAALSLAGRARAAWLAALAGALVSAVCVSVLYVRDPGVRLDMTGARPSVTTGLFPPERVAGRTFAWSGATLRLRLPGADRRVPWTCEAMVINWRPPAAGVAAVRVMSSQTVLLDTTVTAPEATLSFTVPPSATEDALDIGVLVSPTFRPGPGDPRELGLAFDAIRCAPQTGSRAWPPSAVVARGAGAAAALGAVIGLAGVPAAAAACVAGAVAAVHSIALTLGLAPFSAGLPPVWLLAVLVTLAFVAPVWLSDLTGWRILSPAARLAVALSAAACYLKLAFLLHPDKALVDALFHAHRFDTVLGGQFYFTQLSTSATAFPYAIGLYVFAAPWSRLTDDHVLLLRLVVYVTEAGAGLLLYTMLARVWQARAAGVVAVGLFHLVPLPYTVIGNANLTNAFGQSASLAMLAAATVWTLAPRRYGASAGLVLLATLAFVSHVSIVVLLGATTALLLIVSWWMGDAEMRLQTRRVMLATVLGALLAVVLYWGHFGGVYAAQLARTRVGAALGMTAVLSAPAPPPVAKPAKPLFTYDGPDVFRQAARDVGWPVLALAVAGAWEFIRDRRRNRLAALIVTLLAVAALCLTLGAVLPIGDRMQQDVWEFMGRAELGTYVAFVMLAAMGAVRAWQSGLVGRALAAVMVAGAVAPAASAIRPAPGSP